MRILLDTHVFLWWLLDKSELTENARNVIQNSENEIYVSAVSCWEIAIKAGLGRLELPRNPETFISEQLAMNCFESLPVQVSHALAVYQLPALHQDPFDRLLVAQAKKEKLALLTGNPLIARYDVDVVW
jgi:PIN domain nuclease of toxin-antitoxin system